jgi:hypothetical protein
MIVLNADKIYQKTGRTSESTVGADRVIVSVGDPIMHCSLIVWI